MVQLRIKLCKVVASEISKGVKFKKVRWQLAMHNFKPKTSPQWALFAAKFWGSVGFSLNSDEGPKTNFFKVLTICGLGSCILVWS